jgi:syntaxin 18
MFTDNVLKQEIDLNKLSETTISSTENIRGGNEQLREAMKKNAGFRVWVLFFITTLAFTILFLDWYNN